MKTITYKQSKRVFVLLTGLIFSLSTCDYFENKLPDCEITSPADSVEYALKTVIPISAEVNDTDGEIERLELYINNIAVKEFTEFPFSYNWRTDSLIPGEYPVKINVFDDADDSNSDEILVFLVQPPNEPPIPKISVNNDKGTTISVFKFTSEGTYDALDDSSQLRFRWDWDNNEKWDTEYLTFWEMEHVFVTQGIHTVLLEVKDSGSLTATAEIQVNVSEYNSVPTAKFTISPETVDTETEFTVDASESFDSEQTTVSLQVRWDWENDGTWDTGFSTNKINSHQYSLAGTYHLKCEILDSGDSTGELIKSLTVDYCNFSPEAKFTVSPAYGNTQTDFVFDASFCKDSEDKDNSLEVRWDWESDGSWDTGYDTVKVINHIFRSTDTYHVLIEVKDSDGALSSVMKEIFVSDYNSAPVAQFTLTPSSGDTETEIIFSAVGSFDNEETINDLWFRWDWDGDGNFDTGYSHNLTIAHTFETAGNYSVKLEVRDNGDLLDSMEKEVMIEYKKGAPIAVLNISPGFGDTDTEFILDAGNSSDIEDDNNLLQVRWDWENDGSWDTGYDTTKIVKKNFFTAGSYTVMIEVIDSDGLTHSTSKDVIVSNKNTYPIAVIEASSINGDTRTVFNLDASSCNDLEDNNTQLQVRWDWENDGTWDTGYSITKTASHTFASSGSHTINLQVKDSGGLTAEDTLEISVIEFINTAPTASFSISPGSGNTETKFTFNAGASFDNEDISTNLMARWDWENDGTWDTGLTTTKIIYHVYDTAGNYTVKLEVQDSEGLTDGKTKLITVSEEITSNNRYMVFVGGGAFEMGEDNEDEGPVHTDTLNSYYISDTEVSQKEYLNVIGSNPSNFNYDKVGSSWESFPVERVTWLEGVEFCNILSTFEGFESCYTINGTEVSCDFTKSGYRLPTEAEWEYAARGGAKSDNYIFSGSNDSTEVAWFSQNSIERTREVGGKNANELGIFDMSGNVAEWCWDWYTSPYDSVGSENPTGPVSGTTRVIRGGSWKSDSANITVTNRDSDFMQYSSYAIGFRIVRKAD